MVYRQIQQSDNPHLAKIIRDCFIEFDAPKEGTVFGDPSTDNLYSEFQKEGSILFVVEESGVILGCGGIYPSAGLDPGCAELVKLYLIPAARGRGIGKKLLELSMEAALAMGYTSLYIESIPEYSKAVGMYEKAGFKHLDNPLGNFEHPACNIWMWCAL